MCEEEWIEWILVCGRSGRDARWVASIGELTEIVNEYKRGNLSIDTENGRRIEEKSPGRPSPLELPGVRHSSEHPPENGHPLSSRQVSCEVRVDVVDKNTLIWLESKQNALLFNDEYGIARLSGTYCQLFF